MARQIFFFGPLLKKFAHHWTSRWVGHLEVITNGKFCRILYQVTTNVKLTT